MRSAGHQALARLVGLMAVTVTVRTSALRRLVLAAGGPGNRYLHRKTEQVAAAARVNAAPHGTMVTTIRAVYPGRGVGQVINDHPAALFVENGTKRHEIRPRPARGPRARLRFVPTGGDRFVFARKVNHPGNRAYKILTRALRDTV